jgi:hypothetical protein
MPWSTVEKIGDPRATEDSKKRTEEILKNRETRTRVRQVITPSLESRLVDGTIFCINVFSLESIQSTPRI